MRNLSLTCLLCSLWSWGSIWTACFWTCATMLRWVEFRCARCWTSAANTLGTLLVTPPSPTSENWSDWYWEAYPRYVPHFFDVEQLEHSEIFSFFCSTASFQAMRDEITVMFLVFSFFFLLSAFCPVFHPCSLFSFIFPASYLILFLSWTACWRTGSLFQSAVRKFGRDWGAKVYHQVRWAALTKYPNIPQVERLLVDYYSCSLLW